MANGISMCPDYFGQQVGADGGAGPNAQFAGVHVGDIFHGALRLLHQDKDSPGIFQQDFSRVCQQELFIYPVKEVDIKLLFQFQNGLAYCGLGHIKFFGRPGHAAAIAYCGKDLQFSKIQLKSPHK